MSMIVLPRAVPNDLTQGLQRMWPHGKECSGGSTRQERQAVWLINFKAPCRCWKNGPSTLSRCMLAAACSSELGFDVALASFCNNRSRLEKMLFLKILWYDSGENLDS